MYGGYIVSKFDCLNARCWQGIIKVIAGYIKLFGGMLMKIVKLINIVLIILLAFSMTSCTPPPPLQTTYTYEEPPAPAPPSAPTVTANVRDITRVTHDRDPEIWPRVSPNGKQLLFSVYDSQSSSQISLDPKSSSIVLIEIGSAGRKLVAGPYAKDGAWFPDGKNFVFKYLKMGTPILVRTPVGGVGMTFISPQPLGDSDSNPDVSPDGNRIAFNTLIGAFYQICTVDATGDNFTVYTEGFCPRWSPDGSFLAFHNWVGEARQCFILNLKTGQVTQLTSGDYENIFPVWSPDGKWILFVSNRDGIKHIYIMRNDGSHVTQLTKGDSQETHPEWASDNTIYFASDAGPPEAQNKFIYRRYSDIWRLRPILPQ